MPRAGGGWEVGGTWGAVGEVIWPQNQPEELGFLIILTSECSLPLLCVCPVTGGPSPACRLKLPALTQHPFSPLCLQGPCPARKPPLRLRR